ncbi:hypothetical protein TCAL_04305 [Tigriopus californicus]|uniref:Kazal-like domain-containing protein n=1 Tax=Tigriopus californicus TaxID=6832 RepID=A0A553NDG4_TIGCA|nr:uncharacterized protein LOC131889193 [Tigriopus californicus]TRY63496.1 hypothetical protein TCAL_04305 [Tigriopus californicus]|eukprot:TCALIF_04305-PA protein Name:"Protein of unknown function" AED:0.00 eAED:0.00 QI:7/1/1/1/1/1/3/24/138
MSFLNSKLFSSLAVIAMIYVSQVDSQSQFKTVVTYLGTDFILPDGCPLPACLEDDRVCNRKKSEMEQRYNNCIRGEDGLHLGCITDVLPTKVTITIPVYANFCSAYCYEKDLTMVNKLEHCPHAGNKHEVDPNLFSLF